jgi:serine/threonine protein kinase
MTYNIGDVVLSKFKVDDLLSGGTYTQVLRVIHLHTHEVRALKVVRQGASGLDGERLAWLRARFQFEANLVDQLTPLRSSPNLLEVYGYHELDGLPALERQFAAHGSLANLLEAARYAGKHILLMRSLEIALSAADGLAALHNREIIHRDLKPSNILIDLYHNVRLSDLYLAQVPHGLGLREPVGTPSQFMNNSAYLSPEQVHLRPHLTPPSDVYALGAVLFEMLSGVNYNRLAPGIRLDSLRPDIPAWLIDLVERMLNRDPEKRPWSGAIVSALLRAGLDSMINDEEVTPGVWEAREEYNRTYLGSHEAEAELTLSQAGAGEQSTAFPVPYKPVRSKSIFNLKLDLNNIPKLIQNPAVIVFVIILAIIILWLLVSFFGGK